MIYQFVCEVGHVVEVESAPTHGEVIGTIGRCPKPVDGPEGFQVACDRRTEWRRKRSSIKVTRS